MQSHGTLFKKLSLVIFLISVSNTQILSKAPSNTNWHISSSSKPKWKEFFQKTLVTTVTAAAIAIPCALGNKATCPKNGAWSIISPAIWTALGVIAEYHAEQVLDEHNIPYHKKSLWFLTLCARVAADITMAYSK